MKDSLNGRSTIRKKIAFMILLLAALLMAQTEKKQDAWNPIRFLVGVWEGKEADYYDNKAANNLYLGKSWIE